MPSAVFNASGQIHVAKENRRAYMLRPESTALPGIDNISPRDELHQGLRIIENVLMNWDEKWCLRSVC